MDAQSRCVRKARLSCPSAPWDHPRSSNVPVWDRQNGCASLASPPSPTGLVLGVICKTTCSKGVYRVHGAKTLNETYHSLIGRALMGLEYALFRRGPLTMAPSQLGIFTTSSPDFNRANIQFHVQPLSLAKFGDPLHRFPAITVSAC